MKVVKRIIFGIIIAFFLSIVFSSIFPGRVKIVDKVRLFAQKPVIQWIGNIRLDNLPVVDSARAIARVDIDFEELSQYLESIPPGTIFLTRTRSYAISEFIPGMWKHAGIFLGTKSRLAEKFGAQSNLFKMLDTLMSDSEIYILDSEAAGVHVHPFRDMSNLREDSYLTNFTAFTLNSTIEQKRVFIEESLKFLSREYDYDWLTEDESAIYCSELIYHSLKKLGIEIKKRTTTLSREVITPDDLYNYMVKNSGKKENFVFRINICKENGSLKECQK